MGNQLCECQRNQRSNSQAYLSSTFKNNDYTKSNSQQPTQLQQQQYDNPSRDRLNQKFLQTAINASNNILQFSPKLQNTPLIQKNLENRSGSAISLIRMDSEIAASPKAEERDTQDEIRERSEEEKQVKLSETRKRKLSIDSKIEVISKIQQKKDTTLETVTTPEILRSISGYILSEKNLFQPIQVSKENFVRFKSQDIHQNYIFIQKVGEGSFGIVYKVKNRCSGQIRAAKILKRSKITEEESAKLMNQINILRKLDHPNIIKIYQVYLYSNIYCIITQFCEGGSLFKSMREGRHYSEQAIRTIIKKLMSALSYIHKLNIIHRDIKLDNIVFVNKVQNEEDFNHRDIRLIDFGLSKVISMKRVRDREKVGTYTHMAPEVLKGIYSPQCDMWSVGITLFIMVSGGLNPFKKPTKQQTYQSIANDTPRFQGQMWRKANVHLKNLLIKLLNKNMNQRISATQALNHPFLKTVKADGSEKNIFQRVAKKFCDYNRGNNFVSMIESYLSYTVTTTKKQRECSEMFEALDANCDGYIQRQQLETAFQKSGITLSEGEIEYVLGKVDKNNSGKIDYSQFVTIVSDRKKLFTKQSLISAFKYLDTNGNGYLDKDQLKQALRSADCKELSNILLQLDMNQDDKISQQEFLSYLQNQQYTRM